MNFKCYFTGVEVEKEKNMFPPLDITNYVVPGHFDIQYEQCWRTGRIYCEYDGAKYVFENKDGKLEVIDEERRKKARTAFQRWKKRLGNRFFQWLWGGWTT